MEYTNFKIENNNIYLNNKLLSVKEKDFYVTLYKELILIGNKLNDDGLNKYYFINFEIYNSIDLYYSNFEYIINNLIYRNNINLWYWIYNCGKSKKLFIKLIYSIKDVINRLKEIKEIKE